MLRIVGGELGGRKLLPLPKGVDGLRPSSSRVRGAIFDRLQGEVVGATVLDLFAGSGALSIEALSRGASHAVLVESSAGLQGRLRKQLGLLGLESRSELVRTQAQRYLAGAPPSRGGFDLVLIDPPYADLHAYESCFEALGQPGWLAPDALVVVERAKRAVLAAWPLYLRQETEKRHGDCVLHFLRALGAPEGPVRGAE